MGWDKHYRKVVIRSGSPVAGFRIVSVSLAPVMASPLAVTEQPFTVLGVTTDDVILAFNPPADTGTPFGIVGMRVSATNTIQVKFYNHETTAATPAGGTYEVVVLRQ